MTQRAIYIGPWRVDITVRDGVDAPVLLSRLARVCAAALDAVGAPSPASIGLILSDDAELAELNAAHFGVEGPTDVLSFPLLPRRGLSVALPGTPIVGLPSEPATPRHLPVRPAGGSTSATSSCRSSGLRSKLPRGRGGQTGDVRWSRGR